MGLLILDNWTNLNFHTIYESNIYTVYIRSETDFHIFVPGGWWINIWGVLLLALAGAWWQRPERPRKKFNKICFLGLPGEI
jgi:hypothetical protein